MFPQYSVGGITYFIISAKTTVEISDLSFVGHFKVHACEQSLKVKVKYSINLK